MLAVDLAEPLVVSIGRFDLGSAEATTASKLVFSRLRTQSQIWEYISR